MPFSQYMIDSLDLSPDEIERFSKRETLSQETIDRFGFSPFLLEWIPLYDERVKEDYDRFCRYGKEAIMELFFYDEIGNRTGHRAVQEYVDCFEKELDRQSFFG